MMKSILAFLFSVSLLSLSFGQSKSVPIQGTHVNLTLDSSYYYSAAFGYMSRNAGYSFVTAFELPMSFDEATKRGFKSESGFTLSSKYEKIKVAKAKARLYSVVEEKNARLLIIGDDTRCAGVVAVAKAQDPGIDGAFLGVLKKPEWQPEREIDVSYVQTFKFPKPDRLQLLSYVMGSFLYTNNGTSADGAEEVLVLYRAPMRAYTESLRLDLVGLFRKQYFDKPASKLMIENSQSKIDTLLFNVELLRDTASNQECAILTSTNLNFPFAIVYRSEPSALKRLAEVLKDFKFLDQMELMKLGIIKL